MNETVTKEKLVDDVKVVLHDAEALLQETAGVLGEKAKEARRRLESGVQVARARLSSVQKQSVEQAKVAAEATDQFVHEHPWPSIGIAFAVGALVGVLIGRNK